MRKLRAGLGLALILAVGVFSAGMSPSVGEGEEPGAIEDDASEFWRERFPLDVSEPRKLYATGREAEGARAFEALLEKVRREKGADSKEAADALMAMALSLVGSWGPDPVSEANLRLKRASLGFFRRGVEATKAAYGPQHREVAMALTDFGLASDMAFPEAPPPEALQLLREAYEVRLAALGPTHKETRMSLIFLGEAMGRPQRTGRDPSKVEEAASLIRKAAALGPLDSELQPEPRLAHLYAQNGMAAEAARALAQTEALRAEAAAPPATPSPGEGVLCALAIYSTMTQVGSVCRPGKSPELQGEMQSAVRRLSDYVVANGGGSPSDVERFTREHGGVGVPKGALCAGDGVSMYDEFVRLGPDQVRISVDELVARPGPPTLGTCL